MTLHCTGWLMSSRAESPVARNLRSRDRQGTWPHQLPQRSNTQTELHNNITQNVSHCSARPLRGLGLAYQTMPSLLATIRASCARARKGTSRCKGNPKALRLQGQVEGPAAALPSSTAVFYAASSTQKLEKAPGHAWGTWFGRAPCLAERMTFQLSGGS